MKLSEDFRSCLRLFSYYYFNGTLTHVIGDPDVLGDIDYREIMKKEATGAETVFVVYSNNIELDTAGKVTNHSYCMKRAAQAMREFIDGSYKAEPPIADWECELY